MKIASPESVVSGSLRASAVGKSSSLSDAVAIRKTATPLTATARMKPATIACGGAHPLAGLRLLSLDATLEQINFEIIYQSFSVLRPLRRLTAQINFAYAFAAGVRSRGRLSIFKVKML
jgi:hypothetical protein